MRYLMLIIVILNLIYLCGSLSLPTVKKIKSLQQKLCRGIYFYVKVYRMTQQKLAEKY